MKTGSAISLLIGLLALSIATLPSCTRSAEISKAQKSVTAQFPLCINFNGPWAFIPDPDDQSKIVAIAPYIKDHQNAYVAGTNEAPVLTGVYEVAGLPSFTITPNPQLVMVNDTIGSAAFKSVMQNAGGVRYAIRLPMPMDLNAYRVAREAVAKTWPVPNPGTTEKINYTTHMTLRYLVSDFGGIKVTGKTDAKVPFTFNPSVGVTGTLDIGVGPLYDLQDDSCHNHGKTAFKAMVDLLQLKEAIDFPDDNGNYPDAQCAPSDPQNPHGGGSAPPMHGRAGADCKAAMLLLNVSGP